MTKFCYNLLIVIFLIIFLPIVLCSCKEDNPLPPEPTKPSVSLTLKEESSTEFWIELKAKDVTFPYQAMLLNGSTIVFNDTIQEEKIIIYVDTLLPNKTYNLSSKIIVNGASYSSDTISAATLDTTSHNYSVQTWEFGGQFGTCVFYDVAIIDENNIYAVGRVFLPDDSGHVDPLNYNVAHWDGENWELYKISLLYHGDSTVTPYEGVFITPDRKVFFSNGAPILPTETGWKLQHLWEMGVTQSQGSFRSIWGTSFNNIFYCGEGGLMAHYNGSIWTMINTNTVGSLNDIWGNPDVDGNKFILCPSHDEVSSEVSNIIRINRDGTTEISPFGYMGDLRTLWFLSEYKIYAGGRSAIYHKVNDTWIKETASVPFYNIRRIRGNDLNDITAVGLHAQVMHFNGNSWKEIDEINTPSAGFTSVSVKGNIICAVGYGTGEQAMISIFRKY